MFVLKVLGWIILGVVVLISYAISRGVWLERERPGGGIDPLPALALLGFWGIVAAVIFLFLGVETQRTLYSRVFGHPSVPQGPYSPVRVLSSSLERYALIERRYVATIENGPSASAAEDPDDPGSPQPGIRYTVECVPQFWNLCGSLVPGTAYYARWVSSERKRLAIAETVSASDGKSYVAREKTRIFEVRGWQKVAE